MSIHNKSHAAAPCFETLELFVFISKILRDPYHIHLLGCLGGRNTSPCTEELKAKIE